MKVAGRLHSRLLHPKGCRLLAFQGGKTGLEAKQVGNPTRKHPKQHQEAANAFTAIDTRKERESHAGYANAAHNPSGKQAR